MPNQFRLNSKFAPTGDQPQAIDKIVTGLEAGRRHQTLLGATGTGKTFTMANVIAKVQKPTLVLAHNKTLAAQLASEFQEFFPDNAVKYFVSYYDYYQPEAYIPRTDTYIEKEVEINQEIEKYRNSATQSLLSRKDVLIVASVSAIYGLGDPQDYYSLTVEINVNESFQRPKLLRHLTDLQYVRNDIEFRNGTYRVKGDVVDVFPSYEDNIIRIEYFGDVIDRITIVHPITGEVLQNPASIRIFPAKQYVTQFEKLKASFDKIMQEMQDRVKLFESEGRIVEAQRLKQRVIYDLEMLNELGYCNGIENYSRIIEGREPGSAPSTLLDYFPDDYLMMIDESHITIPQVRGMYFGDRSRKENLVNYGFRLPSAFDNRPLKFDEFQRRSGKTIYVSATPSLWELEKSLEDAYSNPVDLNLLPKQMSDVEESEEFKKIEDERLDTFQNKGIIEQIIRPTGLLDPEIEVRPIIGQIQDLENEINERVKKGQRTLVTTMTKRMAEELSNYMLEKGMKVQYLHSDVETIERVEILRDLRLGIYDVIIGINLLREGLDLPEVSLVAILDADKEGFLRNVTSLIQTIGRAARHEEGHVIMYADRMTDSMKKSIEETKRRREIQIQYNKIHSITPHSVIKEIKNQLERTQKAEVDEEKQIENFSELPYDQRDQMIKKLREEMKKASKQLEYEKAAELRDKIKRLQEVK